MNGRKNCHVIIVRALNAITEEQVQELADIGISAVAVGDSRETDENILKGEYKLVFGRAEMWLRKTWINNFKKSGLRFSGNFWILKNMFMCGLLIQLRRLSRNGFFTDCLYSRDLTFTRLLDSVKYESGTFIADFVSSSAGSVQNYSQYSVH